jgi:anti-sigma regulatory factor (Ser/Thr protein kinase)
MTTDHPVARGAFRAQLPFGQTSARTARRMVGDLLAEVTTSDRLTEDSLLVVHELVVNGLSHGRPDELDQIEISCSASDAEVQISVLDQGADGEVVPRPPSSSRFDGRGLAIVEALCASWAVDRSEGTRVSARLAV